MKVYWRALFAVILGLVSSPAFALTGTFKEVPAPDDNPGNLRMFTYVPAHLPTDRQVPLVVALHGCLQTAEDFYNASGWASLADERKFILLLPQQPATNNPMSCFDWYEPVNQQADDGEPLSIYNMIQAVKDHMYRNRIDERAIYVTGLSAGAAMTGVMLATYPQLFTAGAIVAGPPYGCAQDVLKGTICMGPGHPKMTAEDWGKLVKAAAKSGSRLSKVSIWIGSQDTVVNPGNLIEDMKQWTNVLGVPEQPSGTETVDSGVKIINQISGEETDQTFVAIHSRYGNSTDNTSVETWLIQGMGHAVPIDTAHNCGANRSNEDKSLPQNPTTNNYMVDAGFCAVKLIYDFWNPPTH